MNRIRKYLTLDCVNCLLKLKRNCFLFVVSSLFDFSCQSYYEQFFQASMVGICNGVVPVISLLLRLEPYGKINSEKMENCKEFVMKRHLSVFLLRGQLHITTSSIFFFPDVDFTCSCLYLFLFMFGTNKMEFGSWRGFLNQNFLFQS